MCTLCAEGGALLSPLGPDPGLVQTNAGTSQAGQVLGTSLTLCGPQPLHLWDGVGVALGDHSSPSTSETGSHKPWTARDGEGHKRAPRLKERGLEVVPARKGHRGQKRPAPPQNSETATGTQVPGNGALQAGQIPIDQP